MSPGGLVEERYWHTGTITRTLRTPCLIKRDIGQCTPLYSVRGRPGVVPHVTWSQLNEGEGWRTVEPRGEDSGLRLWSPFEAGVVCTGRTSSQKRYRSRSCRVPCLVRDPFTSNLLTAQSPWVRLLTGRVPGPRNNDGSTTWVLRPTLRCRQPVGSTDGDCGLRVDKSFYIPDSEMGCREEQNARPSFSSGVGWWMFL